MNRVFVLLISITLVGCWGGYSIKNIDKPASQEYESWVKNGAGLLDIRKALLECGAPSPSANDWAYQYGMGIKDQDEILRHYFLTTACMEKAGFIARWNSLEKLCRMQPRYKEYPACQPGTPIPDRSVERRLNSWYCKLKTDREYCHKHAMTPTACDDPKKDYTNPPPECWL